MFTVSSSWSYRRCIVVVQLLCPSFSRCISYTYFLFSLSRSFEILLETDTGIIKSAVGAAAGAAVGMVLFRSGGGYRAASTAAGVGVAWGSTYERATAAKNK